VRWPWQRASSAATVSPFVPQPGSGLDAEHGVVSRWVEEAVREVDEQNWYHDVELKSQSSGQVMLDATPDEARRYVHAAAVQAAYWDERANEVRARTNSHAERVNLHQRPDWRQVSVRRRRAATVVSTLMRRALPFEEKDLIALLDWCNGAQRLSMYAVPVGHVTRALQRFRETHELTDALRDRIAQFAADLRAAYDKDAKRYGTAVEQLLAGPADPAGESPAPNDDATVVLAPPTAAPAGNSAVLDAVKRQWASRATSSRPRRSNRTGFRFASDSPFRSEHALLSDMLASVVGTRQYTQPTLETVRGGDRVLRMDAVASGRLLLAAAERDAAGFVARADTNTPAAWQSRYTVSLLTKMLAQRAFALDRDGVFDFALYIAMRAAPTDRRRSRRRSLP
jgi:hypothetical protein